MLPDNFKLSLILLVFISPPVISFSGNETEMTDNKYKGLCKDHRRFAQYKMYCPKSLETSFISVKYKCKCKSDDEIRNESLVVNITDRQLARCVRQRYKGYLNLTTLSCKKDPYAYCEDWWQNFWIIYFNYHYYLMAIICLIGCLTNIINFIVLTKRNMINPINMILAALAVSDFLFLLTGLIKSSAATYRKLSKDHRTYNQLWLETLLDGICYLTFHILSTYLTTLIAGWKYLGIKFPLKSKRILTKRNAKIAIFITLVCDAIYQPMVFLNLKIATLEDIEASMPLVGKEKFPVVLYFISFSDHYQLILLSFALVEKWIPCALLTIFTACLVWSLIKTNRQWRRKSAKSSARIRKSSSDIASRATDKTNKMLLLVLIIFLVTELPSVFVITDTLTWFEDFNKECIYPFTPLFHLFEYLSCTASFFVYVTMSNMFRTTMIKSFKNIGQCCKSKEKNFKTSTVSFELSNINTISI